MIELLSDVNINEHLMTGLKGNTVEPRFNEVAGDWPNLFVKLRVCYIENLDITNLRGNDQNVRYIEVIVNDWLICNTGDFCHAIQCNFRHPEVPRFEMQFIKHGGFQ